MQIIVKKYSDSRRFFPHMNIALGKFISTKEEYLSELKKKNLEPYDKNFTPPAPKTYKPSKKCHEVVRAIKNGTFNPKSSKQIDEVFNKKYRTTSI